MTNTERRWVPYPVRPEPRPCIGCGEAIVPGQSYLPHGPLHVYCKARRR